MKNLKIKLVTIGIGLLSPALVFAQVNDAEGVIKLLERIAGWIYTFFMIAAVFTILLAAWKFLGAGGGVIEKDKPTRVNEAKKMLVYTVIAIIVAIAASSVPNMIAGLIGSS